MNHQEMNLNIRYDLPKEIWKSVMPTIYKDMDGWIGFRAEEAKCKNKLPHWFSFDENEKHISASVEPSGLLFLGLMEDKESKN